MGVKANLAGDLRRHCRAVSRHVREVARGHVAALEKGRPGERYILGGENLTLKQILDKLAAITGLPAPAQAQGRDLKLKP